MSSVIAHLAGALLGCVLATDAFSQLGRQDSFPLPPKDWPKPVMDQLVVPFLLIDRLEYRRRSDENTLIWDAQGWIGGDYHKLWVKSEGSKVRGGETEDAHIEALYARLISPYWYFQIGLREELRPTPSRTSVAVGVQGLAPYRFDVEATAYLNDKGTLSARFEAEHDFQLTQRLVLQPRIETEFVTSGERERGIGRGFTEVDIGLRLRYEIRRQFAPYIGVSWNRKFGETADFARQDNERTTTTAIVAGLRVWF